MAPVIQEDRTGCAIAAVAAVVGGQYRTVKRKAKQLGISPDDCRLWTDTQHMRKLLDEFCLRAGAKEEPFTSWAALPDLALLAIKWHREKTGPAWHWVVFAREGSTSFVLDSKRGLRANTRTDFGRMKPKWFIRLDAKSG